MEAEYTYKGKRQLDFFLSLTALIVLLPLMALVAWGVFISSGRPIIFRRKLIGLGGKKFIVYKFRTMHCNAEALEKKLFKHKK